MTTTEDNKDQDAAQVIANQLVRGAGTCPCSVCAERREDAHRILSALAEAGYTVVKTEGWEYGVKPGAYTVIAAEDEKDARRLSSRWNASVFRRRPPGPWVPVPESSAVERGGLNG